MILTLWGTSPSSDTIDLAYGLDVGKLARYLCRFFVYAGKRVSVSGIGCRIDWRLRRCETSKLLEVVTVEDLHVEDFGVRGAPFVRLVILDDYLIAETTGSEIHLRYRVDIAYRTALFSILQKKIMNNSPFLWGYNLNLKPPGDFFPGNLCLD